MLSSCRRTRRRREEEEEEEKEEEAAPLDFPIAWAKGFHLA